MVAGQSSENRGFLFVRTEISGPDSKSPEFVWTLEHPLIPHDQDNTDKVCSFSFLLFFVHCCLSSIRLVFVLVSSCFRLFDARLYSSTLVTLLPELW